VHRRGLQERKLAFKIKKRGAKVQRIRVDG
jgi:hypothetical protein